MANDAAAVEIPSTVRVLGKTYTLKFESSSNGLTGPYIGHHNATKCLLVCADDLCDDQRADTVLHEAIHAIEYAMKLDLEENQVHALSSGLTALINDNPKLFKALFAVLREEQSDGE